MGAQLPSDCNSRRNSGTLWQTALARTGGQREELQEMPTSQPDAALEVLMCQVEGCADLTLRKPGRRPHGAGYRATPRSRGDGVRFVQQFPQQT
jgi:hypothetical protein